MRNALTLSLFLIMICGCGIRSQRYLRSYVDIEQEGKRLLGKLGHADTAILYLELCSGCIPGTWEYGYFFRKCGATTTVHAFSNYGKSCAQQFEIPWNYILANYKIIPIEDSARRGIKTEVINGDTIQFLPDMQSHGGVYRAVLQIGAEVLTFSFHPGERQSAEGLYQAAIMDSLDTRLKPVRWRLTKTKLKPRWYKSDYNHLRSVNWDSKHHQ